PGFEFDSPASKASSTIHDTDLNELYKAFHTGKKIQALINDCPSSFGVYPQTAEHISTDNMESVVPPLLLALLSWIFGAEEPTFSAYKTLSDKKKMAVLSIAQQIVYGSTSGRHETPFHLMNGIIYFPSLDG